jgi:hypothetical protein
MLAQTHSIPPNGTGGGGPVEYLFRRKDCRKKIRDPEPVLKFGRPDFINRCIKFSRSKYPYTSYVLSYRDEPAPPGMEVRRRIHADCLRFLAGGLADERIVALGVDHGDHEHGLLLRHVADPSWPRFQPYWHDADCKAFSTFQLLVNRRYQLAAPEDPRKHQLLSLAGKFFSDEDIKSLARLREVLGAHWKANLIRTHEDFKGLLMRQGFIATFVPHPKGTGAPGRGWIEATRSNSTKLLLKGPPCNPSFKRAAYELNQQKTRQEYQAFLKDPYPLWNHFLEAVQLRRTKNEKRFPAFMDHKTERDFFGFGDLHPDHYFKFHPTPELA